VVSRGDHTKGASLEKGQRAWCLKLCNHYERALMPRNAVSRIPRAEYLAGSLSRSKPWEAQGMSRAKWYRLGKPDAAETSPSSAETGMSAAETSPFIPVSPTGNHAVRAHITCPVGKLLGELAWLADEFGWTPADLLALQSFCNGETVRSVGPEHAVTESGSAYDCTTGAEWLNPYHSQIDYRAA
jgi:hypothetical protein